MKWTRLFLVVIALVGCTQRSSQEMIIVDIFEVDTPSGVTMMLLPGGKFSMGSSHGPDNERPAHEVTVSPFAIDKYEVTQDLFAQLELPNPSNFKGDKKPVDQIRWNEAVEFCNERSLAEGLTPCYDLTTYACDFEANGYRLPTEAEWEFAARAGTQGDHYFKGGDAKLKSHACYAGNSGGGSQTVGRRRPNAWGLYDMLGNVAEWCNDPYAEGFYSKTESQDPKGPKDGPKRVLRGGSWKSNENECRVSSRQFDDSGIADACFTRNYVGFRCVRRLTPDELQKVLPSESP